MMPERRAGIGALVTASRHSFEFRDVYPVDRAVVHRAALNFRTPAGHRHRRRSDVQIRGCSCGRISHRHDAALFNMVDDRLWQAQLTGGSLVCHLVALFSNAESDNPPPVLEDNGVRTRRCSCQTQSHSKEENANRSRSLLHSLILIFFPRASAAALFRHAECDYTSCMRPGVALIALWCLIALPVSPAAEQSPHELYDALNALRVDPSTTYQLVAANRIELRRGDVEIFFEEGKLAFLAPMDGHTTGFVFSGCGHTLAFPRDVVEKQQMAHFLGAPVLDQEFLTAYVRFTDDAAEDLLRQFHSANLAPQLDSAFASLSDPYVAHFNPSQSLRILEDRLSQNPKPYFYAALEGVETGSFDLLFDPQHREQVLIGQRRKSYYDVWASYAIPGSVPPPSSFHALDYTIDTSVLPDNSLDASAVVHVRADTSGERVLMFQLARALHAETVTDEQGKPLPYFQNEGMTLQERSVRGNDYLHVVLPRPSQKGQEFTIHFHYRGNVIENAGNGVLFVGARESWYPHLGDQAEFAP